MNSRKNRIFRLGLFTLTVILSAYRTNQPFNDEQRSLSVQPQIADGGSPVPPIPPKAWLVADGGSPVPPIPPVS